MLGSSYTYWDEVVEAALVSIAPARGFETMTTGRSPVFIAEAVMSARKIRHAQLGSYRRVRQGHLAKALLLESGLSVRLVVERSPR